MPIVLRKPVPLKYFEIIKMALDATFTGVCRHKGVNEKDAFALIHETLSAMSDEWYSGDSPAIDYCDPVVRFAYLYGHAAVNANICAHAIQESPDVCSLITEKLDGADRLRVCAFGGGPGTELMALSKHLLKTRADGPLAALDFTLIESVAEWSESLTVIETQIAAVLKRKYGSIKQHPFTISKSFVPFDMTRIEAYANLVHVFEHDLYILNYVLSELLQHHEDFRSLMKKMADAAEPGSKFLIVDRFQFDLISQARQILGDSGLTVSTVWQSSGEVDFDEDPFCLIPYRDRIERKPRRRWGDRSQGRPGVFWLVGTKE